jgi:DNA-binding MarR family transcriptional regulator
MPQTLEYAPGVPDHDELHDDLGWLFARLTRKMMDVERPALERHGLSLWGYVVLSGAAAQPGRPQIAVAQGVGLDRTTMVAVLDGLEAAGLVARAPDPADRRARLIAATPKGKRTLTAVRADIRALEDELLARLSPSARKALRPSLRALLREPEGV